MAKLKKVEVGDWVSFYQNGVIVLGQVRYIHAEEYVEEREILTDVGSTGEKYILEIRRAVQS